jgi:hypothetical protein
MNPKEGTTHGGPVGSTGDPKHDDLNVLLDSMRDAGMTVTKKWLDIWFTAVQYAWGQQLQGWKLKEDWEYIVVNRIYPLMFQTIAKLANNHPKILTHAWDDEKEGATEFAERWAGHLQYLWESPYELSMRLKLIRGLLDCAVFGYMVGKTYWESKPRGGWNDNDKRWVGKVAEVFIHPALFWCDPSAESIDTAENCGSKRRVKVEWAVNRWPKYKDDIEKEAYTASDPKYTSTDLIAYQDQKGSTLSVSRQNMFSKLCSLISNHGKVTGVSAGDMVASDEQMYVDIEEIYWRDYTEKKVKIKDNIPAQQLIDQGAITVEEASGIYIDNKTMKPMDKWPQQVVAEYDEPKFPNGRFVLRIGQRILNPKEEDQVYKESRWPFNAMPYHILPHMWQGGNAVEMSRNNNDFLNITVSALINQVRRASDPTKLVEAGALAKGRDGKVRSKYDTITGLGRIVIAARGKIKSIQNMVHPPLDASVVQLADILKKDIDDQMFMQDVARGAAQKGQQTKAEIVRLNQNSLDYVGLQGIFLDKWIDDTGTLVAEICQNNYELGRLIKIIADAVKSGMKADQAMLDVRFDVNIEPGSTLPFDEQKKQNEYAAAYNLLESPVPNPMIEDMLRVLNISKRKEILAKYQGMILFRQFIQMGQLLLQVDPAKVQQFLQAAGVPQLQQLAELLMQVAQLAPQMGMDDQGGQGQSQPKKEKRNEQ